MPLNILHFSHQGRSQWGVIREGRITPVPGDFATTADFLQANDIAQLSALDEPSIPESAVQWLSPITHNQQFICQGANYRQHMIESGMNPDTKHYNMIFTKASSCIVAADADVLRPHHVRFLDYEIELGLVLKRDLRSRQTITEDNLNQYVAGIVIVNDYSARDVQIPQMQFYKGKSYRSFGPVGPYLCLLEAQDMSLLRSLELQLSVNGQVRQRDITANLVHGPANTLTELSGVHDLFTGDLVATGTPAGCALRIPSPTKQRIAALLPEAAKWKMFMKVQAARPQYLQPGDLVEARIASPDGRINLGVQRNRVKEAS